MSTVIAATNTSMMNGRSSPMKALDSCVTIDGKHPDQTSEECSICCEIVTDKAFVNDCLHYFCYKCIKQWISVRAVCPLCVQPVGSIINNVRSVDDYDLLTVEPPKKDVLSNWDNDIDLWEIADDDYDEHDEYDEYFEDEDLDDWVQDDELSVHGSGYGFNEMNFDSDDDLEDYCMSEDNPEEEPEENPEEEPEVEEEEEPLEDTDCEISDVEENPSESENEEAKSSRFDTSEMEDDSMGFDNYCESEYEECENDFDNSSDSSDDHSNSSNINSEGNNDEPDYSYDNFYNDSDDNNSLPDCNFENYHELTVSSYETHTDDSDPYDSFDDLFDDF